MLRPRRVIATLIVLSAAVLCFVFRNGAEYAGMLLLVWLIMMPISLYLVLAKTVRNQKEFTDPKTVDFNSSRIVASGPDWKTEVPWTKYLGFSEDATYFYMHLSDSGLAAVVPKSAFTPEQEQKFREYATKRNA